MTQRATADAIPVAAASAWWRAYPGARADVRLICFAHAGGGATSFIPWRPLLPPNVDLFAVQLPGRETRAREEPFVQLDELVAAAASALTPLLDGRTVFFGHSLGALLAFEVARELRRRRAPLPEHMILSASTAPQLRVPSEPLTDAQIVERLRRLGGTPPELLEDPDVLRVFLPMLRADFALLSGYHYRIEPPLDVALTVFGGRHDKDASVDEHLLPWREQTSRRFACRLFEGHHFFVAERRAEVVCAALETLGIAERSR